MFSGGTTGSGGVSGAATGSGSFAGLSAARCPGLPDSALEEARVVGGAADATADATGGGSVFATSLDAGTAGNTGGGEATRLSDAVWTGREPTASPDAVSLAF